MVKAPVPVAAVEEAVDDDEDLGDFGDDWGDIPVKATTTAGKVRVQWQGGRGHGMGLGGGGEGGGG